MGNAPRQNIFLVTKLISIKLKKQKPYGFSDHSAFKIEINHKQKWKNKLILGDKNKKLFKINKDKNENKKGIISSALCVNVI